MSINLKGEGVSPVLTVSPHGVVRKTVLGKKASVTRLDVWNTGGGTTGDSKHILAHDTGTTSVTLHNSR